MVRGRCVLALAFAAAATIAGCGTRSGGGSRTGDSGADSAAPACSPGQTASCSCPGSPTTGVQVCNAEGSGLGPCTGCPGDGGTDASVGDGSTPDGSSDAPDGDGADGAACAPDDLSCTGNSECCNGQCVQSVCCLQPEGGACNTPCAASGSGVACTHDYDCCGALFGSLCKGGSCCNVTGQPCNGHDDYCCSGVCSGSTCT